MTFKTLSSSDAARVAAPALDDEWDTWKSASSPRRAADMAALGFVGDPCPRHP
jgi:hypothetical protein